MSRETVGRKIKRRKKINDSAAWGNTMHAASDLVDLFTQGFEGKFTQLRFDDLIPHSTKQVNLIGYFLMPVYIYTHTHHIQGNSWSNKAKLIESVEKSGRKDWRGPFPIMWLDALMRKMKIKKGGFVLQGTQPIQVVKQKGKTLYSNNIRVMNLKLCKVTYRSATLQYQSLHLINVHHCCSSM